MIGLVFASRLRGPEEGLCACISIRIECDIDQGPMPVRIETISACLKVDRKQMENQSSCERGATFSSRFIVALIFTGMLAWQSPAAIGEIVTYNVDAFAPGDPIDSNAAEAAFLGAVSTSGYATFQEGFEDSVWDVTRSPGFAASVDSQGINWHSSVGDFITTVDDVGSDTPRFHIYSKGGSPGELHAVPATIIGQSSETLYGLGMWVGGSGVKGKLNVILDDSTVLKFQRVTGYDVNPPDPPEPIKETIRLTSQKQFFGVVAPQGFTKFQLLEVEGVLEDQILMWAADFTFATAACTVFGDVTCDNQVDIGDFTLWADAFGETGVALRADLSGDGEVDIGDFTIWADNFGNTAGVGGGLGVSAVPEPSSFGLFFIGALAIAAYGWRRRTGASSRHEETAEMWSSL